MATDQQNWAVLDFLSSDESDTLIAAMAVGIATITVIFTAYQAFLQRRHNRLSVKPHLTTWLDESEDREFYKIRCDLMNNGIGPAIIKQIDIYFEGQKIGDSSDRKSLEAAIKSKIEAQKGIIKNKVTVIGQEFPFPAGTQETLLEIQAARHLSFDSAPFQDFIDKFDVDIVYHSIYGEKYTHSSKDGKDKK